MATNTELLRQGCEDMLVSLELLRAIALSGTKDTAWVAKEAEKLQRLTKKLGKEVKRHV